MRRLRTYLSEPISIAPLATFRVLFGGVMLVSVIRFMIKGWVTELYVEPKFFFSYYGFEWLQPLGAAGMHVVFVTMAIAALGICLGAFYRVSAPLFFVLWTYVELLDKTNYLNHYYFVSIVAFLMIILPAHRHFSIDSWRSPEITLSHTPRWTVGILRLQLGLVYFFAGLAKVQADWLFRAMPLQIWLPAKSNLPLIGGLLKLKWVAFVFSWMGCVYDLTVPFFLMFRQTRIFAYGAVIAFHMLTWWLFPIGMFPFIMILSTLVFFPASFHEKMLGVARRIFRKLNPTFQPRIWSPSNPKIRVLGYILALHFAIQLILPLRSALQPGELFWHEQGFRFSWRVMLMEKAGYAIFNVTDPRNGKSSEVNNRDYLTANQEKMMATQPDMILQFAHFLAGEYRKKGISGPEVRASVFVTLNGSGSRPFTDDKVDLSKEKETFGQRHWILPFHHDLAKFSSTR